MCHFGLEPALGQVAITASIDAAGDVIDLRDYRMACRLVASVLQALELDTRDQSVFIPIWDDEAVAVAGPATPCRPEEGAAVLVRKAWAFAQPGLAELIDQGVPLTDARRQTREAIQDFVSRAAKRR